MPRIVSALATLALMTGLFGTLTARPASACSADETFDQITAFDYIAAGRLTGWEAASAGQPVSAGNFTPIRVHMTVDSTFKGSLPTEIDMIDGASLVVYDHEPRNVWSGAAGSCGAFDYDPTGLYVIMGLNQGDDGTYRSHRFGWFYAGTEPTGDGYDKAIQRLASRSLMPLPAGGGPAVAGAEFPYLITAGALALLTSAVLAAAALLPRR